MNYLQFEFETAAEKENEILIALLSNAGFESFEEEDKKLKAFIREKEFIEGSLEEILKRVKAKYSRIVIPSQNWNASWESSFEPVIVNDFAAVRAAFHLPIKNVEHEIIITPKMSFGTGHHATTYLMIEQMAKLDLSGKTVLDFGTGTAVLAILAEKIGAATIEAIDNDDWSIENSIENIKANNCTKIKLHKADQIPAGKVYDIILANINLNVISLNMHAIAATAKKGTLILLSGFLKSDESFLLDELAKIGVAHRTTLQKGEWICLLTQLS